MSRKHSGAEGAVSFCKEDRVDSCARCLRALRGEDRSELRSEQFGRCSVKWVDHIDDAYVAFDWSNQELGKEKGDDEESRQGRCISLLRCPP